MGLRLALIVVLLGACSIPTSSPIFAAPQCGNGILEREEVCDDGNQADGDGCSADCKSDETCGNGIIDTAIGELCDDGNSLGGDGCDAACVSDETCGNGVVDLATGETCDDNNLIAGDGCSANCQSNEMCGNGTTDPQTTPPEECDDGGVATANCDPNCTKPVCGDGTKNAAAGEECDDGNMTSADGCDRFCHIEACGNGRREDNEQCDDGNSTNGDNCVQCRFATCGDGFKHFGVEQCDDGNNVTTDGCIACALAVCGDHFVHAGVEACDDGNSDDSDDCVGCQLAVCGDGAVHSGVESCDDGNTNDGDGCSSSCQLESAVYIVTDTAALVNQPDDCGNGNVYDDCNGAPFGFSWNDTVGYTPSSVTVELNRGVDCNGTIAVQMFLNGNYVGDLNLEDQGTSCTCVPAEQLFTVGVDPAAYAVGGMNTFTLSGAVSCTGLSIEDNFGGFARITVVP